MAQSLLNEPVPVLSRTCRLAVGGRAVSLSVRGGGTMGV
nr:hypothetical protein [Kibdelosporangium sp. MJ126-NF4]